ncbi:MAG TPA: hypothetical protein VI503_03430 [Gaiellaceae bacterium]|nr:hypothetical protein [Gaiellaceae bacterium]
MRATVLIVAVAVAAGCGGRSSEATAPLRSGVYEFELSEEYLLENGVPSQQAEDESGLHEVTLESESFIDRWRTDEGRTGACAGTYQTEGNRATFRWSRGCFGDWAMSYSVEGDVVTWSDFEALPPYDGETEQKLTEVFNGVPWTRVGDAPEEGEE